MTTEIKKPLDESELANFTGSDIWYRHWLAKALFTDGANYVFEHAGNGAYWLLDEIVLSQTRPKVKGEEFQVWVLKVDLEKRTGVLTCDDGNGTVVFTKKIEFTDFPLREIKFYYSNSTILLPSEY